jgi:Skp family chaperone for outer membrane proteins
MTPEEQERTKSLCERIAKEQDQEKFLKLVQELNDLLDRNNDRKNQRLDSSVKTAVTEHTRSGGLPVD